MTVKTKLWLKAAGIRAVKTIAQTAVATIGTSAVLGDVNWIAAASAGTPVVRPWCRILPRPHTPARF